MLTIIIPRHVERCKKIEQSLNELDLKTHLHENNIKLENDVDIYIVNSYGKTKSFYNNCKTSVNDLDLMAKLVSTKIKNVNQLVIALNKVFNKKSNSKFVQKKLNFIGRKILYKTYKEIKSFI